MSMRVICAEIAHNLTHETRHLTSRHLLWWRIEQAGGNPGRIDWVEAPVPSDVSLYHPCIGFLALCEMSR